MDEQNYGSLEACQRLVAKGIVLETEHWHGWDGRIYRKDEVPYGTARVPAPSMAEVWRELPDDIYQGVKTSYHLELVKISEINRCTYRAITCSTLGYSTENINPTDALIDLLIFVRVNPGKSYGEKIEGGYEIPDEILNGI